MRPHDTKRAQREELARLQAEFLANGGAVKKEPIRKAKDDEWAGGFNNSQKPKRNKPETWRERISRERGKPFWDVVDEVAQVDGGRLTVTAVARKLEVPIPSFRQIVARHGKDRLFGKVRNI